MDLLITRPPPQPLVVPVQETKVNHRSTAERHHVDTAESRRRVVHLLRVRPQRAIPVRLSVVLGDEDEHREAGEAGERGAEEADGREGQPREGVEGQKAEQEKRGKEKG